MTTKITNVSGTSDFVYVDLTLTNQGGTLQGPNYQILNEDAIDMLFNRTETLPIITNLSEYYFTVIRFNIPLFTIPILICPIIPNQSNPNLTPLVFGINYNGVNYSSPVIFTQFNYLSPPIQNTTNQVITEYYFIYDYEHFINMANTAIGQCWTNFTTATGLTGYTQPFFIFDPQTQLISLILPDIFFTIKSPLTSIPTLFQNEASTFYFDTFPLYWNGYNQPYGRDYDYKFLNFVTLVPYIYTPLTSGPQIYYQFKQNYQSIATWTALQKLILQSSTIPVNKQIIPTSTSINKTNYLPVIADFVPNIEAPGQGRSVAYYNSLGPYRLLDITSASELRTINISVSWQDNNDNIYPLSLGTQQSMSLKILFIKKNSYNKLQYNTKFII